MGSMDTEQPLEHPLLSSLWRPSLCFLFRAPEMTFRDGRAWDSRTLQQRMSVAAAGGNLTGT